MYEKGNVHLAEAAQILQRMVQYEVPALKKQISKYDQTITVMFCYFSVVVVHITIFYNLKLLGLCEKGKRLWKAND